jgi:pantetheine-phosphate adenylyltransferase
MKNKAIYAGSFDPITFGHIDIIERGSKLFSELIIGIGNNINKNYFFSLPERLELVTKVCSPMNVRVLEFNGLLIDFAKEHECSAIIRGLRLLTDFDYEFQLGLTNMNMNSTIETIFLLTHPNNIFISSSMVKEIALAGGDVSRYVPKIVEKKLKEKIEIGKEKLEE